MEFEHLVKMGLTEHEARVYAALLHSSSLKLTPLSRASGIHRPTLYALLPKMVASGLITEGTRGKQKIYNAVHPQLLQSRIAELQKVLDARMPDLERLYGGISSRPIVSFYTGRDSIRHVFADVVASSKKGEVFYRYSSPSKSRNDAEKYLPKNYRPTRDEKGLERLVITGDWVRSTKKPRLEREIKVLPEIDRNDFQVTTVLYANKMAIIDYDSETALVIESAQIAAFQKMLFKQLYNRL